MKLTLEIDLGNAAMKEDEHVATALDGVAERFRESLYLQAISEGYLLMNLVGAIHDANGNKVGTFKIAAK